MIVSQAQQMFEALQTFELEHSDGLSKLRNNILFRTKEQQQALENSQEAYHGMDNTLSRYKQTLLTDVQQLKSLADHILGIHVDFENQFSDNKNKIKTGLSVAQEKCDLLSKESSTITDLQWMRSGHLSAYEAQTEELFKSVGVSRETSEQLTTVAKQLGEDVEAGVRSAVSHGEQAWRNHYSWTEHELRKYSENINAAFQSHRQRTQTLVSGLTAYAESHEAILEQQRVNFGAFVHERQDDLENHCSSISGWSQSITTGLQQCSQDMDKFLDEELQKDIPAGDTPQRRDFSYPRVFAATSPHERILARFHEANGAIIPQFPITEIVSSPSGSSSVSSERSSSDMESLQDVPFRSTSDTDLPSATDSVFNISQHSEPESLKQRDNKENATTRAMKKHNSDVLQPLKTGRPKITSSRKVLQTQN
jgi:kinesin family protein 11